MRPRPKRTGLLLGLAAAVLAGCATGRPDPPVADTPLNTPGLAGAAPSVQPADEARGSASRVAVPGGETQLEAAVVTDAVPLQTQTAGFRQPPTTGSLQTGGADTVVGEAPLSAERAQAEPPISGSPRVGETGAENVLPAAEPSPSQAPEAEILPPADPEPDSEPGQTRATELFRPDALISPDPEGLELMEVVESVHAYFPLVEAAFLERNRTAGEQLAAWGEFDTKLKASTENQPLGFYENYRHDGGVDQPLYLGGNAFAGYRLGRGVFEPWYEERQTNEGGEFKAGFLIPLARNREIDARRAELWRATYDRQLAEPDIRLQLIGFVRDASVTYWEWVAAGQQLAIGRAALELALERNQKLTRRVEEGDLDPPELQDNERAIAERRAKLLDRQRKFEQAAVKLSLFLRSPDAAPQLPPPEALPAFPVISEVDRQQLDQWIQSALVRRPELEALATQARRLRVDLAEASNDLLPNVDAGVVGSQDVGEPTSSKRDKSEFELELGMYFELPVQRRKGLGKIRATRAKLAQLDAKRRFTVDKITSEVQAAVAALAAAYGRVEQTEEAVELAEDLARIERRKFALGQSDLLAVFLREQFAIEAADNLVLALLDYYVARADLLAVLGYQWPDREE